MMQTLVGASVIRPDPSRLLQTLFAPELLGRRPARIICELSQWVRMLSHDLDLSSAVIRSERGAVASRLILSCLKLSHCDELGFPGVTISGPYACVHLTLRAPPSPLGPSWQLRWFLNADRYLRTKLHLYDESAQIRMQSV